MARGPWATHVRWGALSAVMWSLSLATAEAKPAGRPQELSVVDVDPDIVGDVDGTQAKPQRVQADTIWIAMWSFDIYPGRCTDAGWTRFDNRILNDGSNYWHIEPTAFDGVRSITGRAAALGYHSYCCLGDSTGYANDWYYGIRIPYTGAATLSFDYLLDSEPEFDFIRIESDSACSSFDRVDFLRNPGYGAAFYRKVEFSDAGLNVPTGNAQVNGKALRNYGPGTHCVYIGFTSDRGFSPCDGLRRTTLGEAIVIDNISITDESGTRTEDFEDGQLSNGWTFVNMQDTKPFGEWARVYLHITDNDICTENKTCAWLWTDHKTPTRANDPSMSFGPGGYVVHSWLDDIIVSPWVSLGSTPGAGGTVIRFRRFNGNFFTTSRVVASWSVRGKAVRHGEECLAWGHTFQWNSLSEFRWRTLTFNMTPYFDPTAFEIQIRHRVSDWQYIAGASPPVAYIPGPGPFMDDTRIGRIFHAGPVLNEGTDSRSQAQDCFPTEIDPGVTPAGEHFRPTTDRFGSCAFSAGTDLGINKTSPHVITGDSVWIQATDPRGVGGIGAVEWYGAIGSGPHVGKAPPPYAVGGNGFFVVTADSVRNASGVVVADFYFVDLDDTYFRGGDVLEYFWLARDAFGAGNSDPEGLGGAPVSIAAARRATGGLLEVSFLPAIDWAPAYLARIGADPNGDLEPTAMEVAASSQRNCILYVNQVNARRRGGDLNRTSFIYTLDQLGYRGAYDVYDHQGIGNTNNHLGGRATIQQAQGYSLIVYDVGNATPTGSLMPNGIDLDAAKVDQATWFRNWLAQAALPSVGFATLWLIGSNVLEEHPTNPLYSSNMGVTLAATNQGLHVNPDVAGQTAFTFDNGSSSSTVSFTTGRRAVYTLNGGCPDIRNYDALKTSAATAARVYRYRAPDSGTLGDGAIVMNVNATEDWNTILQSHAWSDIRDPSGQQPSAPKPEVDLMSAILGGVLPPACRRSPNPTDAPGDPVAAAPPPRTLLYQNFPNPFNPATTIRFDLARSGRVRLRIYDVAGRRVRTLVDAKMEAGAGKAAVWDGLDEAGRRVTSGLYLYRLEAPGAMATRKMLLVE